jgi:hypothetical protein
LESGSASRASNSESGRGADRYSGLAGLTGTTGSHLVDLSQLDISTIDNVEAASKLAEALSLSLQHSTMLYTMSNAGAMAGTNSARLSSSLRVTSSTTGNRPHVS